MKRFSRVTMSHQVSAVLMVVIVGSLCFSVGEGLRLTPFPVSNLLQVEEPDGLSVTKDDGGLKRSTYGPLDVPSQNPKRSKRQTTDFGTQLPVESSPVVAFVWHHSDESAQISSSRFVSRPAGRAPPSLS